MARIYSRKRGKSGSKKPPIKRAIRLTKTDKKKIEDLVVKLTSEGTNTPKIGTILRDKYGIGDVKHATGKTISQIMKERRVYPELPEDLMNLLRKAVNLRNHLERNKADKHSKKGLENLESKIRRLGKYYVRKKVLPPDWKYNPEQAKLIVRK